jgi:phosphatidylserine decarboxylase
MLAKGSFYWIASTLIFALLAGYISYNFRPLSTIFYLVSVLGFASTVFFLVFFRDPDRNPKGEEDDMVSPADGRIIRVEGNTTCIFMNFHNVHVNRAPLGGIVKKVDYMGGSYIPAFTKDSGQNERNYITFNTPFGEVKVTQIAGIITRRIVSYIGEGNRVERGQRIGMIRFGSRVDVAIPEAYEFIIEKGDRVKAGETVIARRLIKRGKDEGKYP